MQTEDQLTSDMLASTASFINCVGGFNGDVPTEMTRADVDTAVTTLMSANAYTIMDQIEGADKFGTGPVRRSYFGLTNTDMCGSRGLDNVQGFIHAANYPNNRNVLDSELTNVLAHVKFSLIDLDAEVVFN